MDTHFNLRPYVYWFGYEDFEINELENNNYFYQTIILAKNEQEAKLWGDKSALIYCQHENYKFLNNSWIEDISSTLLSRQGESLIDWGNFTDKDVENLFQGTAESSDGQFKNYNILISASSENEAKDLFLLHLKTKKNGLKFSTCSKAILNIVQYGKEIEW